MVVIGAFLGILFIVAAMTGNIKVVFEQLITDATGYAWMLAVLLVLGIIGKSKAIAPLSDAFIILVLASFVLGHDSIFSNISHYVTQGIPCTKSGSTS